MSDESKWYKAPWISDLVGMFTKSSKADKVADLTLSLMRDHTLRKSTMSEAVNEFRTHSATVLEVYTGLGEDKTIEWRLPVIDDVSKMTSEEAAEFKKKLSQLTGACDKKISEQQ